MSADTPNPPTALPPRKVAVIYDDETAGQRAAHMLAAFASESRVRELLRSVAWSVDSLAHVVCRCRAYGEVVPADILVLVISRSERVPAVVNRWLAACLEAKRHRPTTLLASIDSDEVWTFSLEGASARTHQPAREPALPAPLPSSHRARRRAIGPRAVLACA